jgi:hypothetical protein
LYGAWFGCCDCSWFLVEFLDWFLIWLRFFMLDGHLWAFEWSWTSFICEMLVVYPMDLKFCTLFLDMLNVVLALVWGFYHNPSLFYAYAKLMWQFVSHMCLIVIVLTYAMWLPCLMMSNASNFLCDDHVVCSVYSWILPRLFESFLI